MAEKEIKIIKDINKIEVLWKKIYSNNKLLTPFQSYEWNYQLQLLFKDKKNIKYRKHEVYYIILDNKLIFPIDMDKKRRTISILGQTECSDYLDFIYCQIEKSDIDLLLKYLKNKYIDFNIVFDRINNRSHTSDILKQFKCIDAEQKECCCIPIPAETDFYNLLKKGSRQNFRTANNRAEKDGINFKINIEIIKITESMSSELYNLYLERREYEDSDIKHDLKYYIKKLIKKIVHYEKKDLITEFGKNNNIFLSYLLADSKIAAFYEGLIGQDNNIYIVRAAIDENYRKYSFGIILLVNTVQKLKSKFSNFDLTRGNEEYKINYGGVLNFNNCFKF